jgi:hypothetical protein
MRLPQVARGAEVVGSRRVEHYDMDERSGLHRISPADPRVLCQTIASGADDVQELGRSD